MNRYANIRNMIAAKADTHKNVLITTCFSKEKMKTLTMWVMKLKKFLLYMRSVFPKHDKSEKVMTRKSRKLWCEYFF